MMLLFPSTRFRFKGGVWRLLLTDIYYGEDTVSVGNEKKVKR